MLQALADFLRHLAVEKNASAHTVRAYESDLSQLVAHVARERGIKRGAVTPDLLDRDAHRGEVTARAVGPERATVLLGRHESEQAQVAHLGDQVDRQVVIAVPLGDVGRDLAFGEVAHDAAECLVIRRELERHHCLLLDVYVNVTYDFWNVRTAGTKSDQ